MYNYKGLSVKQLKELQDQLAEIQHEKSIELWETEHSWWWRGRDLKHIRFLKEWMKEADEVWISIATRIRDLIENKISEQKRMGDPMKDYVENLDRGI